MISMIEGSLEGNALGDDDGLALRLTLGTIDGWENGGVLVTVDGKFDGNELG